MRLDRRQFLASAAVTALLPRHGPAAEALGTPLRIAYREIQVKGRTKQVFGLRQPNGQHGLVLGSRDRFRVMLSSLIRDPAVVHWHGQEPPSAQDGVPELSQHPIPPNTAQYYDFAPRPGTHSTTTSSRPERGLRLKATPEATGLTIRWTTTDISICSAGRAYRLA